MKQVILMVILLTVVLVFHVQISLAQYNCQNIRPTCHNINPGRCRNNGGVYVAHGGVCGFCDICAIYVGRGARCNLNVPPPRPTPKCRRPLRCIQGRCE